MLPSLVNLKRETVNHNELLVNMYKEFESCSSIIQVISKDGKCELVPSAIKLFSPMLFDIFKSISPTDDISLLIPDFPGSVIPNLYEVVSMGVIDISKSTISESYAEPKYDDRKLRCMQDIVAASLLLGINMKTETLCCGDKDDLLHSFYTSMGHSKTCPEQEYSEIYPNQECLGTFLKQENTEAFLKQENAETLLKQDYLETSSKLEFSETFPKRTLKCEAESIKTDRNVDSVLTSNPKKDDIIPSHFIKNDLFRSSVQVDSFAMLSSQSCELKKSKKCQYGTASFDGKVLKESNHMFNSPPKCELQFKCQYCHCVLKSKSKLEQHERIVHVATFKCEICEYTCIGKADWSIHVKNKHKNTCKECHEIFPTSKALRSHLKWNQQRVKCKQCGYSYLGFCSLIHHMKSVHCIRQGFSWEFLNSSMM